MDAALETLLTAIPPGVSVLRFPTPAPEPTGAARAIVCEGVPDLAELRRVSAPDATWILLVPNALRVPGGVPYETIEGWLADRPHRLYSRAVLAQRRTLDDQHTPLVVRLDETICALAGTGVKWND